MLWLLRKKRKKRQARGEYSTLIQVPGNLTTGIKLPANGNFRCSLAAQSAGGDLVLDAGTRELGVPAIAADIKYPLGFLEKGVTVTVKAGLPGTLSLYLETGLGVTSLIGTG